jgi:hypothetical protein
LSILLTNWALAVPVLFLFGSNLYLNRRLVLAFHNVQGPSFAFLAVLYYTLIYPFAVGLGALNAIFSKYFGLRP